MATIGTFTKIGEDYKGSILTLSVQAKNVRIVSEDTNGNDKAPSQRLLAGDISFGAAWKKTSREGRDYLSVKLDDPSFAAVTASARDDEDPVRWSRGRVPAPALSSNHPRLPEPVRA